MSETIVIVVIDQETFCNLAHAESRLVMTTGGARRDLLDKGGRVIAFSQREQESATTYFMVRRERVLSVSP